MTRPSARRGERAGLVEEEAVARVGDVRDPSDAGGEAGDEAADRHVGVDHVRPLAPEQRDHGAQSPPLRQGREAAGEGQRLDPQALGAGIIEQRAVCGNAYNLVARAQPLLA